ncbi:hypothetical protein GCM10010441_59530 [Kitasatospora paracochleata]|uniref:non-specific serine/threonine protein kinase n=1 Tax=Kitasatospora paracochleata TaxID=58354 RepID=A0ABT1J399_9ACTN|nr:serine/threonine-protein kinase [Kitasatospora paracochleata]MCP2311216.1 hypothetical protein [Kitasatospora paracochleata]
MESGGPTDRLIDGRFELLQRLGGGGMGVVWRARDTALHREVALKEVRPPDPAMLAADPAAAYELRERVLREARALARLQHPNVATIHHIVDNAELPHPWLVMELVPGGSLADRLDQGPLPVTEAARIGRGVLAALRAAHAAGIHHRDVKPGNVLLRLDGSPVLTDFGIAAMQEATSLTATGSLIGSPEYIAPERIRGQEGNPASDFWSLGMTLYVAVEGHHPLRRATTFATLAAVLDEPVPPPIRSGLLGMALARLLQRDPAARPGADELDRLLAAAETGAATSYAATERDSLRPGGGSAAAGAVAAAGTPFPDAGGSGTPFPGSRPGWPTPQDAVPTGGHTPAPWGGAPPTAATGPTGGWGGAAPYAQTGPMNPAGPMHPGGAYPPAAGGAWGAPGAPTAPHGALPGALPGNKPANPRRTGLIVLAAAVLVASGGVAWQLNQGSGNGGGYNAGTTRSPGSDSGVGAAGGSGAAGGASGGANPTAAGSATPKAAGNSAAKLDLLTPAGMRAVVEALRSANGSTKASDLTVYPEYASAKAPTAADPKDYDTWDYRGGKATKEEHFGGTYGSSDMVFDLQLFNWDVLPGLLQKAAETLNVPNPTSRYVIVDGDFSTDGQPTIRVYLNSDHGSGYLMADPKGQIIRTYPRGS